MKVEPPKDLREFKYGIFLVDEEESNCLNIIIFNKFYSEIVNKSI